MPFDNVAIHDGCVARLEFARHLMLLLDRGQVVRVDGLDDEPGFLQVRDPVATAASGRRLVDCDSLRACRRSRWGCRLAAARRQRKERQQGQSEKPAHKPPKFCGKQPRCRNVSCRAAGTSQRGTHFIMERYKRHVSATW
jgi:hypothetical protein